MNDRLSLYELQIVIRDSLYISLPDMYWVTAEISEINENYAGHCFLELIEKQADDKNVRARAKAIIWCKRYNFLKSFFENATGESLKPGLRVLIRVRLEYHEVYGLSLIVCDIDPSFTMGEMALRRQLIIKRLEEEGVFTMNRELDFPLVPRRIAVISSACAAGYSDFVNHLTGNSYGYVYLTKLFESPVQGPDTEQGILAALDAIAAGEEDFDLVVIIRGGGSQSDLSWFDNYNIAYHITQFHLPVITGIGHDKDMSVTDMVANMALKTPTAVADFLVSCILSFETDLMEKWSKIKERGREALENYHNRIEASGAQIVPLTKLLMGSVKGRLAEKTIRIMNSGKEYTRRAGLLSANQLTRLVSASGSFILLKRSYFERSLETLQTGLKKYFTFNAMKLGQLDRSVGFLDPENVLKRGFTLTYLNGSVLKSCVNLKKDDVILTRFVDGEISSRITGKENVNNEGHD